MSFPSVLKGQGLSTSAPEEGPERSSMASQQPVTSLWWGALPPVMCSVVSLLALALWLFSISV